jgi:hypothetical protein
MWPMLPGTPADSLIEKFELVQHVYECQRVGLNEANILQILSNSNYSKYKEQAHMACLTNPISQPSLEISHTISLSSSKQLIGKVGRI